MKVFSHVEIRVSLLEIIIVSRLLTERVGLNENWI